MCDPQVISPTRRRPLISAALAGLLVFGTPAVAGANVVQTAPPPPPADLPDLSDFIVRYDPQDWVRTLGEAPEQTGSEAEDDVVVLEADFLFAAMEWEFSEHAAARIAELVEEVPDDTDVNVHGHTDSNPVPEGYDFDNQELSDRRAEAVAEVLEEERPDLTLNVEGFGDSDPAVAEDPDDPSTYAANRRVEIRYGD